MIKGEARVTTATLAAAEVLVGPVKNRFMAESHWNQRMTESHWNQMRVRQAHEVPPIRK